MSVPQDCPSIADDDPILSQKEVASLFGMQPARVRDWMRGKMAKRTITPLPYVRVGRDPYFTRRQINWWLRKLQEQPDPTMIDVQRARREEISAR